MKKHGDKASTKMTHYLWTAYRRFSFIGSCICSNSIKRKSSTLKCSQGGITIDNKDFIAADVNINVAKAMICNGTTYVPLRSVSNDFGKAAS